MNRLLDCLDRITASPPRLLVIGDVILDEYITGNVERISPEAPVPVLLVDSRDARLGGAASVAMLARTLGAQVSLVGVTGDDSAGATVRRLLDHIAVRSDHLFIDTQRPTTVKRRMIGRASGRHAHQILRIDHEVRSPIRAELAERILDRTLPDISSFDAVLISDYAKGVCTPSYLAALISQSRSSDVPIFIDPPQIPDYGRYRGATLLTPNRIESEHATGLKIKTPNDAFAAGHRLLDLASVASAFVTLDRDGIAVIDRHGPPRLVATRPRNIYDITGAGDIVLAVAGLTLATGAALLDAAELANIAAGLEIERLGVTPVTSPEIRAELSRGNTHAMSKIVTPEQLHPLLENHRANGRRIAFTNGCFDLLHVGHTTAVTNAAALADILIVAVNSDASVRRLKGPSRPIMPESDRALLVALLDCVDYVVLQHDDTPHELLRAIKPDVLAKGGTYAAADIAGREIVEDNGGIVVLTDLVEGISTTRLIASLGLRRADGDVGGGPLM